jgi:magnesium transporter
MSKQSINRLKKKVGTEPGTLTYIGIEREKEVSITLIQFDEVSHQTITDTEIENIFAKITRGKNNWINIDGVYDDEIIKKIGDFYDFHPLIMEDIMNAEHQPKFEDFDTYLFLTLKSLSVVNNNIETEQISLIVTHDFLFSFQEKPGDLFQPILNRLDKEQKKLSKRNTDYLFYLLIDLIVDNYFIVLEQMVDAIDAIEEQIINGKEEQFNEKIIKYKSDHSLLKKTIYPLYEQLSKIYHLESGLMDKKDLHYFNDVIDHIMQLRQMIDSFHDTLSSLMELHLANNSVRMNNIMMSLTVVASIFIPLTFVVGIYGMNFKYMPEIGWKYGYLSVMIFMLLATIAMIIYMKKRKWF